MRKIILLSCLTVVQQLQAQTFEYLNANNIKARIDTSGLLFKDPASGEPGFECPKGSGKHTINGSHIIIGGEDGSAVLKLAASDLNVLHDFRPGPLVPATAVPITGPEWDRVWKIDINEINYHIANYASSGYVPAAIITEWPAYGNPLYSSAMSNCAPFFDHNGNGIYDPMNGDYPLIKGTQAVFQVFNDMTVHATTGSPIGIEIQAMAYVFGCTEDSALNNTVFVHYALINRSTQTLYNTYIGIHNELSIGNPVDNYVGCDLYRGMYYGYNGDNMDNPDITSDNYGNILPVQGVTILRGPYQDDDGIDNEFQSDYSIAIANGGIPYEGIGFGYDDGTVDNELKGILKFMVYNNLVSQIASPSNANEFYNGLTGLWKDGSQPVWGGVGYPGFSGATTIPVDYLYYYDTDSAFWASRGVPTDQTPAGGWREDLHANPAGRRKTIGSCGPFTLVPGAYNDVDVAYTFASNYSSSNPLDALPLLQQRVDSIRSYFISGTGPCGEFVFNSINEPSADFPSFSIYPNPVSTYLNIRMDNAASSTGYTIHDVYGKLVTSGTLNGPHTNIPVSSLEDGIYLIRLTGSAAQKFVVQH